MRREVLVVLLLLGASVPLALTAAGPLHGLVVERLAGHALPAPPTLRLLAPQDGDGVPREFVLVGEARSDRGRVTDVQLRVDGARWSSVPDAPRGERASAFRVPLRVEPGDHVLEVRAFDGDAWSLPARAVVRAGDLAPPSVRIVTPRDGDGVAVGEVEVLGTVSGPGPWSVRVRAGGVERAADIVSETAGEGLWRATLPVPEGPVVLAARATGAGGEGLERSAALAAAPAAPPTLTVVRPDPRSSFGSAGSEECPTPCILFAGVATGPDGVADVLAQLDEGEPASLAAEPGGLVAEGPGAAWSWRLPVEDLYAGPHVARFTPVAPDGTRGAPRAVEFLLRSPRALLIDGDDAPRPTGTPLAFTVQAGEGAPVRWTLDGEPAGEGPRVEVRLARPGDHVLTAASPDAEGRSRVARVPLYALNRAPVVTLVHADPAVALEPARLVAEASDADGVVQRYAWDYGDGTREVTTTPEATHAFARSGAFTVRVTALDDAGGASLPGLVVVPVENAAPLASFRWSPERPTMLDDVRFEDASRDPEGRLVAWSWSFGDGNASAKPAPTHRFGQRGPHAVTLTVRDVHGGAATRTAIVDVQNAPPEAAFRHAPARPATGQEILFTDASRKPDGALAEWRWDFGDGNASRGPVARHAYAAPGRYEVRLTVTDDWGALASVAVPVEVMDAAPLVERIVAEPASPVAQQPVRLRAVAADLEGGLRGIEWDLGDGATATGAEVTHAYARSGTYDVVVVALDDAGQRGILNLTLTVRNAAPLAALRLVDGGYVGYPTVLEADAADPDGNVTTYAFDVDGDGRPECVGPAPRCAWTLHGPGMRLARLTVTDDEGGTGTAVLPLEVKDAPGGLYAPTVRVATPAPDAVLKGEFLLEGTATGATDLVRVDAQLRLRNGTPAARGGWLPATGTAAWTLLLDTRGHPDGAYVLAARATDATGAWNETLVPVTLANGPRVEEIALRVLNLQAGQRVESDHVVRGVAHHGDGVLAVRWQLDDRPWRTALGTPGSWSIPLHARDLASGTHVLRVEANRGPLDRTLVEVPFDVPDLRPGLTVDVPPNPTLYARIHMEGHAAARVAWRIDSGLWRDAESRDGRWVVDAGTDDVTGGPHVVSVKAIDDATGLQSETVRFHVRVLNPTVREAAILHTAGPATEPRDVPLGAGLLTLVALGAAAVLVAGARRR